MEESGIDMNEEWSLTFHGVAYIINLISSSVLLTLEIENEENGERWSGEFTSQYVEEITHKAGNFKKFSLFTKMLSSAFSKTNESVYIDILTLSDLELLKAKKSAGASFSSSAASSTLTSSTSSLRNTNASIAHHLKRYAILTYTGEFDRVHYPLPLMFEEKPNVPSLLRNIRRLRNSVKEQQKIQQMVANEPTSEKEKELRQIVSQLRLDNTELKHKLRQFTSRTLRESSGLNSSSIITGDNQANISSKWKQQIEKLTKELEQSSENFEKQRQELTKDVMHWKTKAMKLQTAINSHNNNTTGEDGGNNGDALSMLEEGDVEGVSEGGKRNTKKKVTKVGSPSTVYAHYQHHPDDLVMIANLKKQVTLLQQEYKMERLVKGMTTKDGSRHNSPVPSIGSTRSTSNGSGYGNNSSGKKKSKAGGGDWNNSVALYSMSVRTATPPSLPLHNTTMNSQHSHSASKRAYATSMNTRETSSRTRGGGISSGSRSSTPTAANTTNTATNNTASARRLSANSRSPSPLLRDHDTNNKKSTTTTSLTPNRFDPTAYHQQKLHYQFVQSQQTGAATTRLKSTTATSSNSRSSSPLTLPSSNNHSNSSSNNGRSTTPLRQSNHNHNHRYATPTYASNAASSSALDEAGYSSTGSGNSRGSKNSKNSKNSKGPKPPPTTSTLSSATMKGTQKKSSSTTSTTATAMMAKKQLISTSSSKHRKHSPDTEEEDSTDEFLTTMKARHHLQQGGTTNTKTSTTTLNKKQQQQQQAEKMKKKKKHLTNNNSEDEDDSLDSYYQHPDDLPLPQHRHEKKGIKESKQISGRMEFPTTTSNTTANKKQQAQDKVESKMVVVDVPKQKKQQPMVESEEDDSNNDSDSDNGSSSKLMLKKDLSMGDEFLVLPRRPTTTNNTSTTSNNNITTSFTSSNAFNTTATTAISTTRATPTSSMTSLPTNTTTAAAALPVVSGASVDVSEIDQRIKALESYLNNARVGIMTVSGGSK